MLNSRSFWRNVLPSVAVILTGVVFCSVLMLVFSLAHHMPVVRLIHATPALRVVTQQIVVTATPAPRARVAHPFIIPIWRDPNGGVTNENEHLASIYVQRVMNDIHHHSYSGAQQALPIALGIMQSLRRSLGADAWEAPDQAYTGSLEGLQSTLEALVRNGNQDNWQWQYMDGSLIAAFKASVDNVRVATNELKAG